jgi:hypothetical protein
MRFLIQTKYDGFCSVKNQPADLSHASSGGASPNRLSTPVYSTLLRIDSFHPAPLCRCNGLGEPFATPSFGAIFADVDEEHIPMSMNAVFVQVEDSEIAGFEADPDSVEALFTNRTLPSAGMLNLAATMQERLRTMGPEQMTAMLSRLPEPLRQQLEGSMRRTNAAMASGQDMVKLLPERLERRGDPARKRDVLSLEKAWHGVHYLLAGAAEPGAELRSQAVLGGVELGDDPEGFSGYGSARYFRAAQVRALSEELRRPEVESEAAARFDSETMSQLQIYPGWHGGDQDKEWLMDAFQRLRDFYSNAAAQGRAIVTCLV